MSRLLIGDNNLSKFWPSVQFSRPTLKQSVLVTATDLDTLDHALSQVEDREQVIISVLTSIVMDEVNQLEIDSSAFNVFEQALSLLVGLCPQTPTCQVVYLLSFVSIRFVFYHQLVCCLCEWLFLFIISFILFLVLSGPP